MPAGAHSWRLVLLPTASIQCRVPGGALSRAPAPPSSANLFLPRRKAFRHLCNFAEHTESGLHLKRIMQSMLSPMFTSKFACACAWFIHSTVAFTCSKDFTNLDGQCVLLAGN